MHKVPRPFFLCMILLLFSNTLLAQVRVGIIPVRNQSDQYYDKVAEIATYTIGLIFGLLGDYELGHIPAGNSAATHVDNSPAAMQKLAEAEAFDIVISGQLSVASDGNIQLQASLYEHFYQKITHSGQEHAASVLDIFDAIDKLAIELAQSFTGRLLRFGSLELAIEPADRPVEITINGTKLSADQYYSERILIGEHHIEVTQRRLFGPETVYSGTLRIEEGRRTRLAIILAGLKDAERQELDEFARILDPEHWQAYDPALVSAALARASQALKDTAWAPELALLQKKYAGLFGHWQMELVKHRLSAAFDSGDPAGLYQDCLRALDGIQAMVQQYGSVAEEQALLTSAEKLGGYITGMSLMAFMQALEQADYLTADLILESLSQKDNAWVSQQVASGIRNDYNRFFVAVQDAQSRPVSARKTATTLKLLGGVVSLVAGVVPLIFDLETPLLLESDLLYDSYQASSDPVEIGALRRQIEFNYLLANSLAIGKWVGVGLGTLLSLDGSVQLVRELVQNKAGGPRRLALESGLLRSFDRHLALYQQYVVFRQGDVLPHKPAAGAWLQQFVELLYLDGAVMAGIAGKYARK